MGRPASLRCHARGAQAFVAATEHVDGRIPVVSVTGEVDMATAPEFEQTLLGAADSGTEQVIVDLTGCSYFDSTGLKALLATRRHLDPMNRRLSIVCRTRTCWRSSGSRGSTGASRSTPRCDRH